MTRQCVAISIRYKVLQSISFFLVSSFFEMKAFFIKFHSYRIWNDSAVRHIKSALHNYVCPISTPCDVMMDVNLLLAIVEETNYLFLFYCYVYIHIQIISLTMKCQCGIDLSIFFLLSISHAFPTFYSIIINERRWMKNKNLIII